MSFIKIETIVLSPVSKVWELMNDPGHIKKWNFAHESWHCPKAENDFRIGGQLKTRMEARDKSFGFDFIGTYNEIIPHEKISYTLEDGRKVEILFEKASENTTKVIQAFEPEKTNPEQMQREGWNAILNNFRKYAESN